METEKQTENKGPCFCCGKTGHSPVTCWYKDTEGRSCKKKGHMEHAYRNKAGKGKMQQKTTFRRKQKKQLFTIDQENKRVTDTSDHEFPLHVLTVKSSQVELYCHSATCVDIQWNRMSCLAGPRCYINKHKYKHTTLDVRIFFRPT